MTMLAEVDFAAMDGVTLWRRIADELRGDIAGGALPVGARLPGEAMLAQRFGVNRHTVRAALKALERDGLVRARQGSGTFIAATPPSTPGHASGERLSVGISGAVAGAETWTPDPRQATYQPSWRSSSGPCGCTVTADHSASPTSKTWRHHPSTSRRVRAAITSAAPRAG